MAEEKIGSPLSEEELKSLREKFDKYDLNKNGFIECNELELAMKDMGADTSNMQAVFDGVDKDSNNMIDFDEWVVFMTGADNLATSKKIAAEMK